MREQSDKLEIEYKFNPSGLDEDVLAFVRPLVSPPWAIMQLPESAKHDTYFDTPVFDLHRCGATFRLRRQGKPYQDYKPPSGFSANYKEPTTGTARSILTRREVRTKLSVEEALLFASNQVPGTAARLAYELLAEETATSWPAGGRLRPVAHVVSYRRTYNIGPVGTDWWTPHPPLYGALLHLVLDDVTAYDVRQLDPIRLLREGRRNVTAEVPVRRWSVGEIEFYPQFPEFEADAQRLFDVVVDALNTTMMRQEPVAKYDRFVRTVLAPTLSPA